MDPRQSVRETAADALGKIGGSGAVDVLVAALGDAHSTVRESAAEVLGAIGRREAISALIQTSLTDGDSWVRQSAPAQRILASACCRWCSSSTTRPFSPDRSRKYLEHHDYATLVAHFGEEGLRLSEKASPDVAIIVIKAYWASGSAAEAMSEGAFANLTKPLDLNKLRLLVDRTVPQRFAGLRKRLDGADYPFL